jgi:hypothetical protein
MLEDINLQDAEWEKECQEILDKERYAEFKATLSRVKVGEELSELEKYNYVFGE